MDKAKFEEYVNNTWEANEAFARGEITAAELDEILEAK